MRQRFLVLNSELIILWLAWCFTVTCNLVNQVTEELSLFEITDIKMVTLPQTVLIFRHFLIDLFHVMYCICRILVYIIVTSNGRPIYILSFVTILMQSGRDLYKFCNSLRSVYRINWPLVRTQIAYLISTHHVVLFIFHFRLYYNPRLWQSSQPWTALISIPFFQYIFVSLPQWQSTTQNPLCLPSSSHSPHNTSPCVINTWWTNGVGVID